MKNNKLNPEEIGFLQKLGFNPRSKKLKQEISAYLEKKENIAIENYDQGGISKSVNWKGGGAFIYCELAKYNEKFIDQIQKAKKIDELMKIWEDMKDPQKGFLNYNVDIKKQDEAMNDFKKLSLEKQKQVLIMLLDKNQLYVNLSEIEDEDYKISEADKKLNREFYEEI